MIQSGGVLCLRSRVGAWGSGPHFFPEFEEEECGVFC